MRKDISVQSLSRIWLFATPWTSTPGLSVHYQLPEFTQTHWVYSLSRWCHPTISSSLIPFSSRLQSFPASGSVQMSQLFASDGQSIGVSASTSVLPMNIQDWFPLGWTGWISLQSRHWDKSDVQMLELSYKEVKAAVMKIHQQVLKDSREANLKSRKSAERKKLLKKKKRAKRGL